MTQLRQKTVLIHVGFPAASSDAAAETWTRPLLGIWWAMDDVVVALLQPPAQAERSGPLLDSDLAHAREWRKVAVQFNRSAGSKYFEVPRGRVLLERKSGRGVIYHGNETGAATLRQVARAFNLGEWRAEIEEHYLMGAEADRLFEE